MTRWNSKWGPIRHLDRLLARYRESVIQDVDIPLRNAPAFLEFFRRLIRPYHKDARFTLFQKDPDTLCLNFGFWHMVRCRHAFPAGHHIRLVEAKVDELGGIRSLHSES